MKRLTGRIQPYAWGSHTAIAALQGRPVPAFGAEAELWLGAHPAAPSTVDGYGGERPLTDLIDADPPGLLGAQTVERFGPRLPFLLKVLAAAQPLSLQAHPDANQAKAGYAAQASLPDGAHRTYVDPYHKPELLVALEDFEALCGFRPPAQSAALLGALGVAELAPAIDVLSRADVAKALRDATDLLLTWPVDERAGLVAAVARAAAGRGGEFALAERLATLYPADLGVLVALLLNHVTLRPDEAVFMPAGNLHAYLRGVGVEVMAASDNVLRGGLTPKHVDVPTLKQIVRYEVLSEVVLKPVSLAEGVIGWPVPVEEFTLVKATTAGSPVTVPGAGPRVLLCVEGTAACAAGAESVEVASGQAVFVAASEPSVIITSADRTTVFQASLALA